MDTGKTIRRHGCINLDEWSGENLASGSEGVQIMALESYPEKPNGDLTDPYLTRSASESLDDDSRSYILYDDGPPEFVHAQSRYKILEELGYGGMGIVYRARDLDLDRDVALKILRQNLVENPQIATQFTSEARIIGSLQHPGIAQVYECGHIEDGRPFHSMKLVEGITLQRMIRDSQRRERIYHRLLNVFSQVCQTMAYTHSRGIVHLDLKPANIMIGAFGTVHVMDWGLAKVLESPIANLEDTVELVGGPRRKKKSVRGTLEYMAPEQALARPVDQRTDVFGLGAILAEILTDTPVYVGENRNELLADVKQCNIAGAHERIDECDADIQLKRLAIHCLQPSPKRRPKNATLLASEMNIFLESTKQQAEHDMTRFFELSLDLFCIAGTDGYFRRINKNFSRVLGFTNEELLKNPFLDFVVPDDRDRTVEMMKRLLEGQPVVRFRNRYLTKSGDAIEFEWMAKSLPEEGLIFAVARNVLEQEP